MSRRLSSYRFRRRAAFVGALLVLGTAVAVGSVLLGNTGKSRATPIDRSKPAWVYHPPPTMHLTRADRDQLVRQTTVFIQTAVARKHLDSAWALLAPEMKAGQTRKSWDTGNNNVVPFPAVGIAAWRILYAYRNDVAMDVAVIGAPGSDWIGKTFTIELKRPASTSPAHWLVASWTPKGVGGAQQIKSVHDQPVASSDTRPPLSAAWLLLPLGVFCGLFVVLGAIGVRSYVRHRRAARRYEQVLRGYNSTSSPS